MKIIIVTGLSGSGRTTAMKVLEDAGFYCVDNLPISFLPEFIEFSESGTEIKNLALSVDVRALGTFDEFSNIITNLKASKRHIDIIFTEAIPTVLIRRYSESRRPHPFPGKTLDEAINNEIKTLSKIRDISDVIIDSSRTNVHEFKSLIKKSIDSDKKSSKLNINIISFGFKYGLPLESDYVLDVRFLPNPFFNDDLKPLTGLDKPVMTFIARAKETKALITKYFTLMNFLLAQYSKEGRATVTIAIGCTGGKHRSVYIAERLKKHLRKRYALIYIKHRDIKK